MAATKSTAIPRSKYKLSSALERVEVSAHSASLSQLVFLGDEAVGTTSIITRFMYDTFESTYKVKCAELCDVAHIRNACPEGHYRHRLRVQDHVPRGQNCSSTVVVRLASDSIAVRRSMTIFNLH